MGRYTEKQIAEKAAEIQYAPTGAAAMKAAGRCAAPVLRRIAETGGIDLSGTGPAGYPLRILWAYGWSEGDTTPPDMRGPCQLGAFEAHSRRPWECRGCARRQIDHLSMPVLCGTCADYAEEQTGRIVRDPALGYDWVHRESGSELCPGQEDDDTGDLAQPLVIGGRYVVTMSGPDGRPVLSYYAR